MKKAFSGDLLNWCIVTLLVFMFQSCSKEPAFEERLIGTWRSQEKNVHSILSFINNGSFTASNRIEGKHSKIIEKRGNVKGKWLIPEEGKIAFDVVEPDSEIGWNLGMLSFEIKSLTQDELIVTDLKSGKTRKWMRVRGKSTAEATEDNGTKEISLGPVVVNLNKSRAYKKERFVCVDVGLSVDVSDIVFEEGEEFLIHPQIHEATVFYLSSRQYTNVKTYDNIKVIHDELFLILEPYFKGRLKDLRIRHIVVTASKRSVEEFIAEYSKPASGSENGEGEEGEG